MEAHRKDTQEKLETKSTLQMPPEMKTVKDSVKSLIKKGARSKIRWTKSKDEKEHDNKIPMDKQQKKEEKEKRILEDKKRKLQERYELVMMKQGLEEIEVSRERYFQSYREREKRFDISEVPANRSSTKGLFIEGLLKNADVRDTNSTNPRRRTVSISCDNKSLGNDNINEAKANRITKLFDVSELNSAIENSRRDNLSELTKRENGCKARQDIKKVTENTQKNNNNMDEARKRRIVAMFAAKEHNAALLKSRASKANGLNTTGNEHKPDGNEVIELNHNDSKNNGIDSEIRSVVGYTKTPLHTTEHENYNKVVSKQQNAQEQRMKKYTMRITEVDICENLQKDSKFKK